MGKNYLEERKIMEEAYEVLERLVPTFVLDSRESPSNAFNNLIGMVSSQFESFDKVVELNVRREIDDRRFDELKTTSAYDRVLLETSVKKIFKILLMKVVQFINPYFMCPNLLMILRRILRNVYKR